MQQVAERYKVSKGQIQGLQDKAGGGSGVTLLLNSFTEIV